MVEQGRTQLFMMLVQQAGAGSLPISNLTPDQFLQFVRTVESMGTQQGLSPIVVYWSSRNAKRLMPEGPALRQLQRDAFCISVFSEERSDKQDEFCFLIESQGLCLVVYGYKNEDEPGNVFQCVGSVDPQMVRKAFQTMLPVWQFIDLAETNRLEDARNNVGTPTSAPNFVQICRTEWPVVKPYGEEYDTGEKVPVLAGEMTLPVPGQPTQASAGAVDFKPTSIFLSDQAGSYMDGELLAGGELGAPQPLPTMPSPQDEIGAFIRESQTNKPAKSKRDSKSMRGLREVWTNISQASIDTYPPDAQRIIRDIVGQLRHSSDLSSILQLAIEQLTGVLNADRGLIWQVIGDQLTVTNEHAPNGHTCFVGTNLGAQESTAIVLEFLSRFPDESGAGVIAIPDTMQDAKLHKMSPTLASLIELGEVRARLVAQLRCRGIFSGFLELQQCKGARQWSDEDAAVLQCVAEVLSFVVQQAFDLSRIETDAQEMKLINEISLLFRESKGQRSKDTLARSVKLVAEHMGFIHSQIYLYNEEEFVLVSQITEGEHSTRMELSAKDNPFVSVFESGRGKVINAEYTRKGDPFFQHDTALIVPLISEGERLGVMGLWERHSGSPHFRAQDRELAITIAGNLASIIRADQAIAQLRADRARERLINRVSQEIRQSLKEVDQILETLVVSLREHLELGLCVVSLYDGHLQDFTKSKTSGVIGAPVEGSEESNMAPNFGEQLFLAMLEELAQGKILIMSADEIKKQLDGKSIEVPGEIKAATLVPLIQGETFKGALCMVSCDRYAPFSVKDMNMITDLADRVAVVIAHKELFEQVERQAVTDPMTGLFNRRFFQEQLSKEIDRHQRFGHPFSYIILDLDFLKKINDGLGHQFGDAAIKHIANVLKKAVRDVDTTARYGGEEFVVLLPETDAAAARIVADRICTMIREKEVDGIGTVTASVGVSTFPHDAQDRDKLTELADQALYLAKHRGRNQVCTVSEHLVPSLKERGEEALEVQKATIKAKADELASIDLKLIAEHGLLGILGAIIKLIEARDAYTNDRSPRAADYAGKLAQALHLSKEHTTIISLAAILHNIGKIAISEDILKKKEALTEEERKIIETSPTIGAKILEPAKHLHRVAAVVEAYHEHWDGSGYPKGLKGEDIPLESRIIALIDAYVAMTSDRPYRDALSNEEAIQIMRTGAGKDWDPRLVKLFLSVLSKENLGPSKSPSV